MKKAINILSILFLLFFAGINYSFAAAFPNVEIKNVNITEITDVLVSHMMDDGFNILNKSDYQISFRKDVENMAYSIAYGGGATQELRIFINFVQLGNDVKITAEGRMVVKPNTAFENQIALNGNQVQPLLDAIKFEFNGDVRFGINFDHKKKNGCYPIIGVVKNSSTEKAGIEIGDLIVAVDGKKSSSMNYKKFDSCFIVPEGTSLTLLIRKPSGEEKEVIITKEFVPGKHQKEFLQK